MDTALLVIGSSIAYCVLAGVAHAGVVKWRLFKDPDSAIIFAIFWPLTGAFLGVALIAALIGRTSSRFTARYLERKREGGEHDKTEVACWHCLDVLEGPPPKPRCERCPDECDDANCEGLSLARPLSPTEQLRDEPTRAGPTLRSTQERAHDDS